MKERSGILICGAYGLGNTGDEAILTAILQQVRSIAPEARVTVLSRNPGETAAIHNVRALHMFDLPAVWRAMGEARLYINGGGTLIQDATSRRSLWYYLFTLRAARLRGCRVLMYGCGIGPVSYRQDRQLTRRILNQNVDVITLREADSREELERMGVTKPEIILSSDPALTLERAPEAEVDEVFRQAGIPPQGQYICFALRNWKGYEQKAPLFGAAARRAYERHGLTPVFVSIEKYQDPDACRPAARGLEDIPHYFLDDAGRPAAIIGAIARMRVVVSMRLHALIFAAGQGVPLVGVVYDPKVSAFLRYMDQDLFADLDTLEEQQLLEMVDRAVERTSRPEEISAAVERLRAVEHRNADAALRLLQQP